MAITKKKITPKKMKKTKLKRKPISNGQLIKIPNAEGLIALDTAEVVELVKSITTMDLTMAGEQVANIAAKLKSALAAEKQQLQDLAARVKAGATLLKGFETMMCARQRKDKIEEAVYATTDRKHKLTVKATTSKTGSLLVDDKEINKNLLGAEELVELFEMLYEDDPDADVKVHVRNAFIMLTQGKRAFVRAKVELVAKAITDVLKERREAEKEGIPALDADLPERLEGHVELKFNNKDSMVLGEEVDIRK